MICWKNLVATAAMVAAVVAAAMQWVDESNGKIGDWGYKYAGCSTYTHWRQFGANKCDASSDCSNIQVQCLASKQSSCCAADRFYLWRR